MESSLFHSNLVSTSRILYTPSTFARANLIFLQEAGFLQAQKAHTSKRENLSSYLFFIVLSGEGTLEYNHTTYNLKQGDCVFIDCKKPYSHHTSQNLWQLRWVHFYGPNMTQIYDKYAERGGTACFHPQNLSEYDLLLQQIYQIANSDTYVRDMMIYEKLITLLTLLMKDSWNPQAGNKASSSKKQNLADIKEYLDQNYQQKITLDELSRIFFINKFYLTRVFKEQFGVSVNNYLLQLRITHAKQLLRFSDQTIESIAVSCGLEDPNYFARLFKKVEGITPTQFRETW